MSWIVAAAAGWILLAIVVALIIGQAIRLAERQRADSASEDPASEPEAPTAVTDHPRGPAHETAAALESRPTPAVGPRGGAPVPTARPSVVHHCISARERATARRHTGRG